MKKNYLLLLFCLPCSIMAQIITQSDFPIVGTSYTLAKDSTYSGTIPSPLENQTWNFASLKNLVLDTTAFIEPNGTPYADDFPFSFLATHSISNDTYVYYNSAVDGFYVDGIGNPNTILSYNPSLLFVPVPFSFGPNDRNSVARIQKDTVNSLSQNIRIVIYFESEFKAYASGTLTIPSGTYSNVLGVRVSETRYDTLYVDTSGLGDYVPYTYSSIPSYHYRYFSSGLVVNYLLGIDADSLEHTTYSEYFVEASLKVPTINATNRPLVYPNPAINTLNFGLIGKNTNVVVYDNYGKEILKSNQIDKNNFNVEMFSNGIYHYMINQDDNIQKGSFVIQH